ncbi:MAG: hypothetical protein AAF636_07415 [Pseudomonadota bacterium]
MSRNPVELVPVSSKQFLQRLSDLREAHDHCVVVALVDLSTELILSSSTQDKLAQEKLDRLCQSAARAFGTVPASVAVECGSHRTSIFVRSADYADEALCFLGNPDMDLRRVMAAAHSFLEETADDAGARGGSNV